MRSVIAPLAAAIALFQTGCANRPPSVYGKPGVSSAPNIPWIPPAAALGQRLPAERPIEIPAELLASKDSLGLANIVDIALRSSSETREAWANARGAAAAYGSQRGDYLPDVSLNAGVGRQKGASSGDRQATEQRTYGGSVSANWLLFNFGGRRAGIDETRQALLAADWTHNAVIQNVVLRVEQAYYDYVATGALLDAEESSLKEAQSNLDAAEGRHRAGLATIADVLQARTALSQVELSVETLRGQIATTRGALATAMGLPANTAFEVEAPPDSIPVEEAWLEVEEYLEQAKAGRPDLAAARARAFEAAARVRKVRAEGYPSLSVTGSVGRVYPDNPDRWDNTHAASLQLGLPLFTGFSHLYDVQEAKADADAARARYQSLEQAVVLQVWTSYYGLNTAGQRLKTANDLMRSATESHEVALGRYQAGVGTILDLLTAQAALADARAKLVQARSDWFVSLAQLAHDTGSLSPSGTPVLPGGDRRKESKP